MTSLQDSTSEYLDKVNTERGRLAASQARYFLKGLPSDLSPRSLDAWRTELKAGSLAPSSINRKLSECRSFLLWAARTERLDVDKAAVRDNLAFYRVATNKVSLPSQPQIKCLLRSLIDYNGRYNRDYAIWAALCLFTGMRPGEAEMVSVDDFPQHKDYARVCFKTGATRHVYYKQSTTLSRIMPELRKSKGKLTRSGAREWFKLAAGTCEWPNTDRNTLRKLFASYMACSGRYSEYELMQQLGHTSTVSIRNYRDPDVLDSIRPGACVEAWMDVVDEGDALADIILA